MADIPNPLSEHVMLYSDIETAVRENAQRMAVIGGRLAILKGLSFINNDVFGITVHDTVDKDNHHYYLLSLRDIAEEDNDGGSIPFSIDRQGTHLLAENMPKANSEDVELARLILRHTAWMDISGMDEEGLGLVQPD